MKSASWDTGWLLKRLGTPEEIIQRCKYAGLVAPAPATIRAWKSRDRIPASWLATMLLLIPEEDRQRALRTHPAAEAPHPDPFS